MEELIEQFQPFTPKNKPLSKKLFTEVVCFFMIVILRVEMTDAKYNNMHTAAQRKIAALRRAAGAMVRQIFWLYRVSITKARLLKQTGVVHENKNRDCGNLGRG